MTPREVFEALRTDDVTDYITERGTHEGCGQCCSRFLPLSPAEAAAVRLAGRGKARPERPETVDLTCPLLTEDLTCSIYEIRPAICRAYDCSAHKAHDLTPFFVEGVSPDWRVYDVRELVS